MTYVFVTSMNAWGGIERQMVILMNKLSEKGHQVHLLIIRNGVIPYESELRSEVVVHRISKLPGDLFLAAKIRRYLVNIGQPIVILFKLNDAHLFSVIKKKNSTSRICYVICSTLSKGLSGNQRRRSMVSRTLNNMDKLICVSHGVSHHIISSYGISPEKVKVIYNPLIDSTAAQRVDECNHPWLQESKPSIPTFISAGRLVNAKNFPALIRAFAKVYKQQKSRLIILGEGLLRSELETLIKNESLEECVSLPGYVDNPKSYFRRSSAFVLSSRNEGLGNVLVEALEAGIPVISTDCPNGPREILEDGKLGFLVKLGDIDELANAMLTALNAPMPPAVEIANSLKRFDADLITDQYIELTQARSDE